MSNEVKIYICTPDNREIVPLNITDEVSKQQSLLNRVSRLVNGDHENNDEYFDELFSVAEALEDNGLL